MAESIYEGNLALLKDGINGGYEEAKRYYAEQRDSLAELLEKQIQISAPKKAESEVKAFSEELLRKIRETTSNSKIIDKDGKEISTSDKASELLGEVEEMARKNFKNNVYGLNRVLQEAFRVTVNEMREDESSRGEKIKNFKRAFIDRLETKLKNKGGLKANLTDNLSALKMLTAETSEEVAAQLESYYVRSYLSNLEQVLGEELNLNNQSGYANAIKGYYLEEAETSAIQRAFEEAIKVFNPSFTPKTKFAANIAGDNTSVDIKFDLEALLPKEATIEVSGSAKIDETQTANDIKNMVNKSIKEFGAQVKSRMPKIDSNGNVTGWQYNILPVGSRESLLARFLRTQDTNNNLEILKQKSTKYKPLQIQSMLFFANDAENIKEALGQENIMFIDGAKHYWMDEFITIFRKNEYYLQFAFDGGTKQGYSITPEVILYDWQRRA